MDLGLGIGELSMGTENSGSTSIDMDESTKVRSLVSLNLSLVSLDSGLVLASKPAQVAQNSERGIRVLAPKCKVWDPSVI